MSSTSKLRYEKFEFTSITSMISLACKLPLTGSGPKPLQMKKFLLQSEYGHSLVLNRKSDWTWKTERIDKLDWSYEEYVGIYGVFIVYICKSCVWTVYEWNIQFGLDITWKMLKEGWKPRKEWCLSRSWCNCWRWIWLEEDNRPNCLVDKNKKLRDKTPMFD